MRYFIPILFLLLIHSHVYAQDHFRIGVTTHAYYSWVARIVEGAPVQIEPIVPSGQDLHSFQPKPQDIERIAALQAVVSNDLGHDPFLERLLEAAGNRDVPRIDLHRGVPLIPYHRGASHTHGGEEAAVFSGGETHYNPHTFISLTTAIQQIYNLQKWLSSLLPEQDARFRENTRTYTRKLREMKAQTASRLALAQSIQVATVHDGYAYLLQEFGIPIKTVIQPKHGIEPSAQELAKTIDDIRKAHVDVIFSELDFPKSYVDIILKETGCRVYYLSHISQGEYRADKFELDMQYNLETLVLALTETQKKDVPK